MQLHTRVRRIACKSRISLLFSNMEYSNYSACSQDVHSPYFTQLDYIVKTLKDAQAMHDSYTERIGSFERWFYDRRDDRQFSEPWDL